MKKFIKDNPVLLGILTASPIVFAVNGFKLGLITLALSFAFSKLIGSFLKWLHSKR